MLSMPRGIPTATTITNACKSHGGGCIQQAISCKDGAAHKHVESVVMAACSFQKRAKGWHARPDGVSVSVQRSLLEARLRAPEGLSVVDAPEQCLKSAAHSWSRGC
jgi:hypothetical protein